MTIRCQLSRYPRANGEGLPDHPTDFSELDLSEPLASLGLRGEEFKDRLGKLTDLVFRLSEPYPEAVGIYVEHGWGKPDEFIPWDRVVKIDDDADLRPARPRAATAIRPSSISPAGCC